MIKNYLLVAWRKLIRNKTFSILNVLGLSLGIGLVMLIAIFIQHEYSHDSWIEDGDLVYRVYRVGDSGETSWTPGNLANKMATDYPEVATASGWGPGGDILVSYANNDWFVDNTAYVDSTFLDVLPLKLLHGDASTALDDLSSLVISHTLAQRIFGDRNPVGEVLELNNTFEVTITGVLAPESKLSHIKSDLLTRFRYYGDVWRFNNRSTYVKLKPSADPDNLIAKVQEDVNELITQEYVANGNSVESINLYEWRMQPLSEVYLHSEGWTAQGEKGSIRFVYILGLIGLLVLIVAIVNYVNLTTAQASERGREIGVRKVSGAGRGRLTAQFIIESMVLAVVAGVLAIVLAELFLPSFNEVVDRDLSLLSSHASWVIAGTLGLSLLTGLLAGSYPALVMARFQPANALKSSFLRSGKSGSFRKVLVISQFAICVTLIIVMAFIYRQVDFMLKQDLGFQPEQIVTIPINDGETRERVENQKARILQIPGVENVTLATAFPGAFLPDWNMVIEGMTELPAPYVLFADEDYAETLGIEMVAGRFIDHENEGDFRNNFVVNEEFIRQYDIDEPIGTRIKWDSDTTFGQIVGVMEDFHFRGLNESIGPLVMNADNWRRSVGVKISGDKVDQVIPALTELWAEMEPAYPMRYSFLDDDFAALYASHERFGQSILYATILTLFIALMGLFGLTTFTVRRRTKEIGIRKVLGASVGGIVALLAKDQLKLLMLACLLAIPLGYFIASQWLSDFAHRTSMSWWIFLLAVGATILLGFSTVSVQSARAAMVNPKDSLETI